MTDPMYNIGMKRAALAAVYHKYRTCKAMIDARDEQGWRKACIELSDYVRELDYV